jgi:hypothetical protein
MSAFSEKRFLFPFFSFHFTRLSIFFAAAVLLRVVPGLVNATQSQQPQRKQEKKRKVRVQHVAPTLGGLQCCTLFGISMGFKRGLIAIGKTRRF